MDYGGDRELMVRFLSMRIFGWELRASSIKIKVLVRYLCQDRLVDR